MAQSKFKVACFYLMLVLSIVFTFRVFKIVIYDLMNLTSYGWGYLMGNIVFALVFAIGAYISRKPKNILH